MQDKIVQLIEVSLKLTEQLERNPCAFGVEEVTESLLKALEAAENISYFQDVPEEYLEDAHLHF